MPVVGSSRNKHGRARDHRRREVEASAHPARVRAHQTAARVAELELVQQLACALARLAAAEVVETADHLEVLGAGQVVVDGRVLAGEPDPLANLGRMAEYVDSGDARRALVGLQQRGQDPHCRRLAGTVRPEQAEHDPGLHAEVDPVERDDLAIPLTKSARLDREPLFPSHPSRLAVQASATCWGTDAPLQFEAPSCR